MSDIEHRQKEIIEQLTKKIDVITKNQEELQHQFKQQSITLKDISQQQTRVESLRVEREQQQKQEKIEKEYREKYYNKDGTKKMYGSESLLERDWRMENSHYGEY